MTPAPVLHDDNDDDDAAGLGSESWRPARGHVSVPALSGDAIPTQDGGASPSEPARPGASLPLSSVRAGPSVGRRGEGDQDPGLSKSGSPRKHQEPRACAPAPLPLPLQGQHHLWMLENFSPKKLCFFEGKKTCATGFLFQTKKKKKKSTRLDLRPPRSPGGGTEDSDAQYSPSSPFARVTNNCSPVWEDPAPQLPPALAENRSLTAAGAKLRCQEIRQVR